jgi:hypothetical protein
VPSANSKAQSLVEVDKKKISKAKLVDKKLGTDSIQMVTAS